MSLAVKAQGRVVRKGRIRKKLLRVSDRPRLSVFRSARYVYAKVIDDKVGQTLAACSSQEKVIRSKVKSPSSKEAAKAVGAEVANRAKAKSISTVVFDRNGFSFHGRIAAIAEGAREAGLNF